MWEQINQNFKKVGLEVYELFYCIFVEKPNLKDRTYNKQRIKLEKKDRVRPGGTEDRLLVPSLKQHRYAGQDEGGLSWGEKENTTMNMSTQKQLKKHKHNTRQQ